MKLDLLHYIGVGSQNVNVQSPVMLLKVGARSVKFRPRLWDLIIAVSDDVIDLHLLLLFSDYYWRAWEMKR